MTTTEGIKAYKGFGKNLQCRDFQYEVGKTYTHDGAVIPCESGFHACENPLSVFEYYSPFDSRFCEVTVSGEIQKSADKTVASVITVERELLLDEFIQRAVDNMTPADDPDGKVNTGSRLLSTNTGSRLVAVNTNDYSVAVSTGDCSASTNRGVASASICTGIASASMNMGDRSVSVNTGYHSVAINKGDSSVSSSTGYNASSISSGYRSVAVSTGETSDVTSMGDRSVAVSTGRNSAAVVTGKSSVAVAYGKASVAKAAMGSYIILSDYNKDGDIVNVLVGRAGKDIEPDTYYTLKNGEFVKLWG